MARFRKKPVEVEAVRWFRPGDHPAVRCRTIAGETEPPHVRGRQGTVVVHPGDWIITEPDGSGHYPCADDIFRATYEPVGE